MKGSKVAFMDQKSHVEAALLATVGCCLVGQGCSWWLTDFHYYDWQSLSVLLQLYVNLDEVCSHGHEVELLCVESPLGKDGLPSRGETPTSLCYLWAENPTLLSGVQGLELCWRQSVTRG